MALVVTVPPPSTVVAAVPAPRVAIIVGPSGTATARLRTAANSIAASARTNTSNVVVVESPRATLSAVNAAVNGAAVVIYLGRGRGFPSPYSTRLSPTVEDGFGLNASANHGDSNTHFYGETSMRRFALAPNAVVLLLGTAYAGGAGDPGMAQPSLATARARVDNYAAGFLAAGAAAVIADLSSSAAYYIREVFRVTTSLDSAWRGSPTRSGHVTVFNSSRTVQAAGRLDPETSRSGFDRSIVGRLGVSTLVVRSARAAIRVAAPPYGSAINADDLNNSVIGGPDLRKAAYRFRATTTAGLSAIRVYLVTGIGYSGGTNGAIEVTVQTDDGSAAHRPSGAVLAATTYVPGRAVANDGLPSISFRSPAQLIAGQLYHVVFRNVDASPTVNYISVDGLFTFGDPSPWQPRTANTDWANLVYFRGAWSDDRGAGQGVITPIMALSYSNGVVGGQGYMEVWVGMPKAVSGASMVREAFTVSGATRSVRTASVRVHRVSGSSPLTVRLETAAGALVAVGTVPAGQISTDTLGDWGTASFGRTVTLAAGRAYHLVLEAPSDTTYSAFAIREGAKWGFPAGTYFADGTAQCTTGSGWYGFDQPSGGSNLTMGDLQFVLR